MRNEGLLWREDGSNEDPDYCVRNQIRSNLIPTILSTFQSTHQSSSQNQEEDDNSIISKDNASLKSLYSKLSNLSHQSNSLSNHLNFLNMNPHTNTLIHSHKTTKSHELILTLNPNENPPIDGSSSISRLELDEFYLNHLLFQFFTKFVKNLTKTILILLFLNINRNGISKISYQRICQISSNIIQPYLTMQSKGRNTQSSKTKIFLLPNHYQLTITHQHKHHPTRIILSIEKQPKPPSS